MDESNQGQVPKRKMIDNAQYARCTFINREIKELQIQKDRLVQKRQSCIGSTAFQADWSRVEGAFHDLDSFLDRSLRDIQGEDYGNSEIFLVLQDAEDSLKSELYWRQIESLGDGNRDTRYG